MSLRNERVRKALMREISDIILKDINDLSMGGMISIIDVEVSSDNSAAKIFYSVFGTDEVKKKTIAALERHVGQIRSEIGKRIRLRKTPLLTFIADDSLEKGAKMTELINKIERGEIWPLTKQSDNYFLNIYKPKGLSSFDIIRSLRKKLCIKEIGHSGTLDPLADGVMQIGVGYCTKLLDYLDSDKTYTAKIKFGYNSTTYDDEGEKTWVKKPDFTLDEFLTTLNSFLGITLQIPPKYSAIKQNGKKLYELVRKNPEIEIKIKPREIQIYSIKLLEFNNFDEAIIEVFCKKGTYIRSLAYDIGKKLSCGAYIKELTRTKAGNFDIKNSNKLDDEYTKIFPLDVLNMPKIELNNKEYDRIIHGNYIKRSENIENCEVLLTKNNILVSLAKIEDNLNGGVLIKPKKNFMSGG